MFYKNNTIGVNYVSHKNDKRSTASARELVRGLMECLKEKPMNAITVSDIHRATGVSRATFYRLFDTPAKSFGAYMHKNESSLKRWIAYRQGGNDDIQKPWNVGKAKRHTGRQEQNGPSFGSLFQHKASSMIQPTQEPMKNRKANIRILLIRLPLSAQFADSNGNTVNA